MSAIDFTTALARLLGDGLLRDEFARDPGPVADRLGLSGADRATILGVRPQDLEYQATILIRKRFELARRVIPLTCHELGDLAWPAFLGYGRRHCPRGNNSTILDAHAFCVEMLSARPKSVSRLEWNRLRFTLSRKRGAARLCRHPGSRYRLCLQILFRFGGRDPREILIRARF